MTYAGQEPDASTPRCGQQHGRDLAVDRRRGELHAPQGAQRRRWAGAVPGRPGLVRERHLGRGPCRRQPRRRRRPRPVAQHRRRRHLNEISTWWAPRSAHADQHAIVAHPGYDGATNQTASSATTAGTSPSHQRPHVGSNAQTRGRHGWKELDNTTALPSSKAGPATRRAARSWAAPRTTGRCGLQLRRGPRAGRRCRRRRRLVAADPTDPTSSTASTSASTSSATSWRPAAVPPSRPLHQRPVLEQAQQWACKPVPFRIHDARTSWRCSSPRSCLTPTERNACWQAACRSGRPTTPSARMTPNTGPTWSSNQRPDRDRLARPPDQARLAVAKGKSDLVWVGHNNGDVYPLGRRHRRRALTWIQVRRSTLHASNPRLATATRIQQSDPDRPKARKSTPLSAATAEGNVWKTSDSGTTWTDISGGLPEAPVRSLVIHPSNPSFPNLHRHRGRRLRERGRGSDLVADERGPGQRLGRRTLLLLGKTLYAATHGRGLFRIDLSGT